MGIPRAIKARCSFRCRPRFDHTVRTANVDLTLSLGLTKLHPNEYDDYDAQSIASSSSAGGISASSTGYGNGCIDQSTSGQMGIIDSGIFHQAYGRTTAHGGSGASSGGYRATGHSRNPSTGTQVLEKEGIMRGAAASAVAGAGDGGGGGGGGNGAVDSLSFGDMVQAGNRTEGLSAGQPNSQPGSQVLAESGPHRQHLGRSGSRRGRGGRNVVMQRQRLRFMAATEITKVGMAALGLCAVQCMRAALMLFHYCFF